MNVKIFFLVALVFNAASLYSQNIPNYIDTYVGNSSIQIVKIVGSTNQVYSPTDLDFNPTNFANKELWVCNRGTENIGGSTVTIWNASEPSQTSLYKKDDNSWHFMSLTTGLAFSENGNWATSPGVFDANHDGGAPFTGPSLWSSDMNVYAEPSGGNGSHLDMLHQSPYSRGIAAEIDNVFWVFDGYSNDIVRYDFGIDHGPGGSFHGDGIIRRYADDVVLKDPNDEIVSHLELDANSQWLYVVDYGNQRVIRIDITTGWNSGGSPIYPMTETVSEYSVYTGYTQETVVTGLSKPAGIDVVEDRMIVSEYETGEIVIYDISSMPAVELDRFSTGYSSVQGITIGPEGFIWFVDEDSRGVYKAVIEGLGVGETELVDFELYPNPVEDELNIVYDGMLEEVVITDLSGKLILSSSATSIDISSLKGGMYLVSVLDQNGNRSRTEKVIKQ